MLSKLQYTTQYWLTRSTADKTTKNRATWLMECQLKYHVDLVCLYGYQCTLMLIVVITSRMSPCQLATSWFSHQRAFPDHLCPCNTNLVEVEYQIQLAHIMEEFIEDLMHRTEVGKITWESRGAASHKGTGRICGILIATMRVREVIDQGTAQQVVDKSKARPI